MQISQAHDPVPHAPAVAQQLDQLADRWRHVGIKVRGAWLIDTDRNQTHRHADHWQLLLIHRGAADYASANVQLHLREGMAAVFRPWDVTRVSVQRHLVASVVLFGHLGSDGQASGLDLLATPFATPYPAPGALDQAIASYQIDHWPHKVDAMAARFVVDRLLWDLTQQALEAGDTYVLEPAPRWWRDLVAAAGRAIADPAFGVAALAREAGCSQRHLARCCQRYRQQRPLELLRELRVDRLRNILRADPSAAVERLVRQCGFGSPRRLHTQVRAVTGTGLDTLRGLG